MPTIDLGAPPPTRHHAPGGLPALPRRVTLTLPELCLVAERAGGAPLPFDVTTSVGEDETVLSDRLGRTPAAVDAAEYAAARGALHDPESSLSRRGLLVDTAVDEGLLGAVGLLAKPDIAVDLDVTVGSARVTAWHRQRGGAVATLATSDGLVFEIGWFASHQWPGELGRVARVPEDVETGGSAVPEDLDLPYELLDAAAEAARTGRTELLSVLVPDLSVITMLTALTTECHGRLRALVANVSGDGTDVVGVVSWALLADGWRALRPQRTGEVDRVVMARVQPADLARELAPVLAEVSR
jgi:hypothetical protein